MWKHLRGLKLLKWQLYWEQKEQYVMEEMKEKRETGSILRPFQSCILKQNKTKIQEDLEGSQPNAVIS